MLGPGARVLVGVSGGADSVSLLLVLRELGYPAIVAHLNHGLRGKESDGDEQFVAALAARLGLPFFCSRVSIRPEDGNVEATGRTARREFFQSVAAEAGLERIALAHTQDDRVETFLLHLMRGAGTEGLVSMAPVSTWSGRHETTIRPLIDVRRKEVEAYLRSCNQDWRIDATNADVTLARNRIRHEVLPDLSARFNPRLNDTLARTIELLQDEDQWMRELAERWIEENAECNDTAGGLSLISIDASALAEAPPALARRVIRASLKRVGSSLENVTFERIEQVRGLLEDGKSGKTIQVPGGILAAREFRRILFRQADMPVPGFSYNLSIPGTVRIAELGRLFRAEVVKRTVDLNLGQDDVSCRSHRVFVDGGSVGTYVNIRSWKPGDFYRPAGWPAGKLKKLFQRAKIPRSQRSRYPVFVSGSAVVWVDSFPVSREFVPSERSQSIVAIEVSEADEPR
jgi:tRNA(Ile)-lysidine synthase